MLCHISTFFYHQHVPSLGVHHNPTTNQQAFFEFFSKHTDELARGIFYQVPPVHVKHFFGTECKRDGIFLFIVIYGHFFFEREPFLLCKRNNLPRLAGR